MPVLNIIIDVAIHLTPECRGGRVYQQKFTVGARAMYKICVCALLIRVYHSHRVYYVYTVIAVDFRCIHFIKLNLAHTRNTALDWNIKYGEKTKIQRDEN